MNEALLTVAEVAARLKCHPHTVRRWVWASKLKAIKVGDMVRISEDEVARFLQPQDRSVSLSSPDKGGKALVDLMGQLRPKVSAADVQEMELLMAAAEQAADWKSPLD